MLILSRRTSESIIIGDEVTITVLSVKGKQVRIGIDAPPHISVHREEIYDRIKAEGDTPDEPVDENHGENPGNTTAERIKAERDTPDETIDENHGENPGNT